MQDMIHLCLKRTSFTPTSHCYLDTSSRSSLTMLRSILHLLFVLLYVITIADAHGNTKRLRNFYRTTAYSVQKEGRRMLTNELKKDYKNERENHLRNKMIRDINALDVLYLATNHDQSLCDLYEGFKLTKEILESYNELKNKFATASSILDAEYRRIATQCQKLTVGSVKPGHSSDFSLLLTNEDGVGQFMGQSANPNDWCCRFANTVDGETHQLQFRYQGEPKQTKAVRYGDVVAIWTKSKYLLNEGPNLNWYAWDWSNKMKWTIEPFCSGQANNQDISQCDLVTFLTHNPYEPGYYLIYGNTGSVKRDGVFAVLSPGGRIPL